MVDLVSVTRPLKKRPPGGVAALFSCSEGQVAYEDDDLKHGVFFHFVIQGLKGKADEESGNRDGKVDSRRTGQLHQHRGLPLSTAPAMTSSSPSCSRPTRSTWSTWVATRREFRHQLDRHEADADPGRRVPDGLARTRQGRRRRREAAAPGADHAAVLPGRDTR